MKSEEKLEGKNGKNESSPIIEDKNTEKNNRVVEKLKKKEIEKLENFLCIHSKAPFLRYDDKNYRYVNPNELKSIRKVFYGLKLYHMEHPKGFKARTGKLEFYEYLYKKLIDNNFEGISMDSYTATLEKLNPIFINISCTYNKKNERCLLLSLNKLGLILVGLKKGEGINKTIFDKEDDN